MKKEKFHYSAMVVVLLGLIIFFGLLSYSFLYLDKDKYNIVKPSQESNIYVSELNGFSIDLTGLEYEKIEDNYNLAKIITKEGEIIITVNGTNFSTIHDYIDTFDSRRNIKVLSSEEVTINGKDNLIREVSFPDLEIQEKTYNTLLNHTVYTLSTDSPELYDELDQIANSFEYTGK